MSEYITKEDIISLFPKRDANSHKGTYGYVGICGGYPEYSGATKLANMAQSALKSGCGVSRLIVPASIRDYVAPYLLESTLSAISSDSTGKMIFNESEWDLALSGLKSLAIGMGWGASPENVKILSYILTQKNLNLVIDADGINSLEGADLSMLANSACRVAITPHPKEFSRISGFSMDEIMANPEGCSQKFAKKYNCVVLLKGSDTVVTDGENTYISNTGTPGMATAGSGDVLSGILAGLLGYLPVSAKTIAAGAFIAGLAGELATEAVGEYSHTAGDTVSMISKAVSRLLI